MSVLKKCFSGSAIPQWLQQWQTPALMLNSPQNWSLKSGHKEARIRQSQARRTCSVLISFISRLPKCLWKDFSSLSPPLFSNFLLFHSPCNQHLWWPERGVFGYLKTVGASVWWTIAVQQKMLGPIGTQQRGQRKPRLTSVEECKVIAGRLPVLHSQHPFGNRCAQKRRWKETDTNFSMLSKCVQGVPLIPAELTRTVFKRGI